MKSNKSHQRTSRVRIMTAIEAAWLAGFFDGEGSISKSRVTNGHSLKEHTYWKLSIPNTSKEALKKVIRVTGIGKTSPRSKDKKHHKQLWLWQVHAVKEIQDIARQILPYVEIREKLKRLSSAIV
jgi:hypothetical protein